LTKKENTSILKKMSFLKGGTKIMVKENDENSLKISDLLLEATLFGE